jgi:AAA domain
MPPASPDPVPDPPPAAASGRRFRPLAGRTVQTLPELWEGYMQRGVYGILEGDWGLGKSALGLQMVARLTKGKGLGPGAAIAPPARPCFILNGEMPAAEVQRRLEAMNADLGLVCDPTGDDGGVYDLEVAGRGLDELEEDVAEVRPALIWIDTITALAPQTLASRPQTRLLVRRFKEIAERYETTILVVRHLNKTGRNAKYRGQGHVDLGAQARFILLVGEDPERPGHNALVVHKKNDGPKGTGLGFTIADGTIVWGEPRDLSAEDILRGTRQGGALADARRYWQTALADAPRPSEELMEEGEQLGLSKRTLSEARGQLDIAWRRVGVPGGRGRAVVFCRLPDRDWPPDEELARLAAEFRAQRGGD